MEPTKARYAQNTEFRTLADARWSAPTSSSACRPRACSSPEMVKTMADKPLIFALANPTPRSCPSWLEVRPRRHHRHRPFGLPEPGQQRAVLPFIFRGAPDAGATTITEEMKLACVKAIAELAEAEQSDVVARPTATPTSTSAPTT